MGLFKWISERLNRRRGFSMEEAAEIDAWGAVYDDFEREHGRPGRWDDADDRRELDQRFETKRAQIMLGLETAFGADSDLAPGEVRALPGGGYAIQGEHRESPNDERAN